MLVHCIQFFPWEGGSVNLSSLTVSEFSILIVPSPLQLPKQILLIWLNGQSLHILTPSLKQSIQYLKWFIMVIRIFFVGQWKAINRFVYKAQTDGSSIDGN